MAVNRSKTLETHYIDKLWKPRGAMVAPHFFILSGPDFILWHIRVLNEQRDKLVVNLCKTTEQSWRKCVRIMRKQWVNRKKINRDESFLIVNRCVNAINPPALVTSKDQYDSGVSANQQGSTQLHKNDTGSYNEWTYLGFGCKNVCARSSSHEVELKCKVFSIFWQLYWASLYNNYTNWFGICLLVKVIQ